MTAMPHLSRYHQKEKGRKGTLAIETGKARISLLLTAQNKPLLLYMKNHHQLNKYGGKIMN
jgi:hypothetical protein